MRLDVNPSMSITETLNPYALDTPIDLYLAPGVYFEKLRISHHHLRVFGSLLSPSILSFADYAYKMNTDGLLYNTFRSYTVMILGNYVEFHHIVIENTCGRGEKIGQGVALHILGTNTKFYHCQMKAHQDTLFIGPLPRDLNERYDHFLPLEERHELITHTFFDQCIIEGDVDFIFGSGVALFKECQLHFVGDGYLAAPSTYQEFTYGFIFLKCTVDGHEFTRLSLGRPWRNHAKLHWIDCKFNHLIEHPRYDDWGKTNYHFYESPYVQSPFAHPMNQEEMEQLERYLALHFNCSMK
jgi:pectinesterase